MRFFASSLTIIALWVPNYAVAQPSRGALELQAPVLAEQNDATAIAVNPAQIALLRGWNLTYAHSRVENGPTAGTGHGAFFAMPLPFGLGWGVAVELARPDGPGGEGLSWRSPFTIALAWQYARRLSIGVSSRWFFNSDDPGINGLWAVDIGVTFRLNPIFAVAATAHSINNPIPQVMDATDAFRFSRQWSLGLLVRPARRDYLSIAAEVSYAEEWDRLTVRGIAAVRPVPGWTVRADVGWWYEGGDSGVTLALTTELALSMLTVGGGASMTGLDDGSVGFGGYSVTASLSDDGHGAVWERPRVVQIVLDDGPTTRSLAAIEHTLLRAIEDRSVRGVLLTPRRGFSASLGEIQDIRWILERVQRAGKQVACYLDDGSGSGYFLCAGADRVFVNVGGGIRVSGLRMTTLYLGDAMDRFGVQFEMIRIGDYKSSPEQLTEAGPSPETQEQTNAYLSSTYRRYIWELSQDRGVSPEAMTTAIDGGPYLADGSVEAGLVDQAIYADELEGSLEEVFGRRYLIDDDYAESLEPTKSWRGGPAVGVIHIEGNLSDGNGWDAGPEFLRSVGGRTIARAIEQARANRQIKALVLRIDSPGGSVLASDLIWRSVMKARKSMPIIASMGGVAASGGYYVASAAHKIYATPMTLTGSIGVYYGKVEVSGLMEKLGVSAFHYRRGKRAGHNDWTRPWTPEEREGIKTQVKVAYDRFLDRIVKGRESFDRPEQVDAIAQGRIWSGSKAKQIGLVDEIGGLQHAIEAAAQEAGLGRHYEVVHLPRPDRSLLERAAGWIGLSVAEREATRDNLPPPIEKALELAAPLIFAETNRTQALLPFAYEIEP